jgi:hypothetical protein
LPEFLPTLGEGAPAVGVFFQIFICEHGFEGSPLMIEIEHIFDQEPIGRECRNEEFVDPLSNALAHRNPLVWCGGTMSSYNDACVKQSLIQWQPAVIKQLDLLLTVDSGYPRGWWVSEYTLDLRMLQDSIPSGSCDQMHACSNQLSNSYHIAILPIEADQSKLCCESKKT